MAIRPYAEFWAHVGRHFPDLGGAASTRLYAANEQRLFRDHFPPLDGLTILKTDLWDEARNTRILVWAAAHGARAVGIDIAAPTVALARQAFPQRDDGQSTLGGVVGDVRAIPLATGSVDAVYSMGTVEHFDATDVALGEIFRVVKPGGHAIIGVPNRHDPFLRPLLSAALQAVGLYAYGAETAYSRRTFRQMLERAGFVVDTETAILFIPGWLRMLDLACHTWCRPLAPLTTALVQPFVWLDAHVPAVRRHGYLLATAVRKPVCQIAQTGPAGVG